MPRQIDPERIKARELDDDEIKYLRDRGRLPLDYFEAEPVEQSSPTIGTQGGIEESDEEEDYEEGWTNAQRRAELSSRKLSIEGRKDELIARLRRSDLDELEEGDREEIQDDADDDDEEEED